MLCATFFAQRSCTCGSGEISNESLKALLRNRREENGLNGCNIKTNAPTLSEGTSVRKSAPVKPNVRVRSTAGVQFFKGSFE